VGKRDEQRRFSRSSTASISDLRPNHSGQSGSGSSKTGGKEHGECELNAGLPVPDDRLTVAAFLDRWLTASLPGQVSEKTFDSYADTVPLHIKPSMGRKILRKLTVSDVDQLLA
jgi:hypothetical protein